MNRFLYFVDPMCSWCYGFAPELAKLVEHYGDDLPVGVIVGGLRAGETRGMTAPVRQEIQHHWQQVSSVSGQPFQFDGALPDGFVYDTEPACRAVVAVRRLAPERVLAYLDATHRAFYAQGRDVTGDSVLGEIATEVGIESGEFLRSWSDSQTIAETEADFELARDHAVTGFPTLLLDTGERKRMISMGYQRFDDFKPVLDARMVD